MVILLMKKNQMGSNRNKTGFIVQARLGSTRLSKKVMLPFFEDQSILELLIIKLASNFNIPVIVATTTNQLDDVLVERVKQYNVHIFRGSENNVLKRFVAAAQHYNIKNIIRICSDNPFLSVKNLHQLISSWDENYDYHSFRTLDGTPSIQTHYGFWAEMVSLRTLVKLEEMNVEKKYREHVTNYIYTHPQEFNVHFEIIPEWITELKNVRLTLDTARDFEIQQEIYKKLNVKHKNFDIKEIIKFLDENPHYYAHMKDNINQNLKK